MQPARPGLQLDESLRQQRIEWTVIRVAWPALYLALLAMALGLLGSGPFAQARLEWDGEVSMRYARFGTARSTLRLDLQLRPSGDAARLTLGGGYLDRVRIEGIVPAPREVVATADGATFVFAAAAPGPVGVRMFVEAHGGGRLEGLVSADGGPPRRFSQLVLP